MIQLFTPDYYIHSFAALRPSYIKEQGIKLLICDIDNTLVAHDEQLPDEPVIQFVEKMKKAGIQIVFISNNVEERVRRFAEFFKADYYSFALKPLPITYRKMLKKYDMQRKEVAMLGDQLLTDILGANLMGFHTILTAPRVTRDLSFTKVNRIVESVIFKLLKITKRLCKGEYDE